MGSGASSQAKYEVKTKSDLAQEKQQAVKDALTSTASLLNALATTQEKIPGLGQALLELQSMQNLPKDPTTWLINNLRASRPAEEDVAYGDSVLEGLVMKCDEFANIHILKGIPQPHPEVWNFRKTDADLSIYGVGQCHLNGLEFLSKDLKSKGHNKVLWFNMREEPVVFLSGQACAPRSTDNMNENVDYLTSIEGFELERMEKRLCEECIEAASKADSKKLSVFYQNASGGNDDKPSSCEKATSMPVKGAYDWLKNKQDGASIIYERVPIQDELAPEEADFDQLVMSLKDVACASAESAKEVALVFNCQMGRGRTTTGMVCASILMLGARGWTPAAGAPETLPAVNAEGRNLARGEFKCVLQLLNLLEKVSTPSTGPRSQSKVAHGNVLKHGHAGLHAKILVDQCIDACAHAQNMVEAIVACVTSAAKAEPGTERSPEFWHHRGVAYLQRYMYLLIFAAYALEEGPSGYEVAFSTWNRQHWQFKQVVKKITLE